MLSPTFQKQARYVDQEIKKKEVEGRGLSRVTMLYSTHLWPARSQNQSCQSDPFKNKIQAPVWTQNTMFSAPPHSWITLTHLLNAAACGEEQGGEQAGDQGCRKGRHRNDKSGPKRNSTIKQVGYNIYSRRKLKSVFESHKTGGVCETKVGLDEVWTPSVVFRFVQPLLMGKMTK